MRMHRQSLSAYGAPLCETIVEAPRPQGTEVLVRIERCGVCHSDLHMQDGYFLLGGGKKLDVQAGRTLPFTLGHEIAGVLKALARCDELGAKSRLSLDRLWAMRACRVGERISAPRRAISESRLMAALPRTCSCHTLAT